MVSQGDKCVWRSADAIWKAISNRFCLVMAISARRYASRSSGNGTSLAVSGAVATGPGESGLESWNWQSDSSSMMPMQGS